MCEFKHFCPEIHLLKGIFITFYEKNELEGSAVFMSRTEGESNQGKTGSAWNRKWAIHGRENVSASPDQHWEDWYMQINNLFCRFCLGKDGAYLQKCSKWTCLWLVV